jgi:hypothetical protein
LCIPFIALGSCLRILFFPLISVLSSGAEILSSLVLVCWNGFQVYFLFDLRNFLFPGFLFNSIFSEIFYIVVKLFHILCCLLYFIYLFLKNP